MCHFIGGKLLLRVCACLLVFLFSRGPCFSQGFEDLYSGRSISWHLTPNDLVKKWSYDELILWFGVFGELSVSQPKKNVVQVTWTFSHHPFVNPSEHAITEPFKVKEESTGYFSFDIELSGTIEEVKKLKLFKMIKPYFAITVGKPVEIISLGNKKIVKKYFTGSTQNVKYTIGEKI